MPWSSLAPFNLQPKRDPWLVKTPATGVAVIQNRGNIMDSLAKEKFADRIAIAGSDGFVFTAPVGTFRSNAFGLHDMHGNVWEWTADWFGPPTAIPQTDPHGPDSGKDKVVRGGDWYHDWSFARSAQRYPIHPSLCRRHAGFRILRQVSP
jgi:sulfatase modifying factor 1